MMIFFGICYDLKPEYVTDGNLVFYNLTIGFCESDKIIKNKGHERNEL